MAHFAKLDNDNKVLKVADANAASVSVTGSVTTDTVTVAGYTIYNFTGDGVYSSG